MLDVMALNVKVSITVPAMPPASSRSTNVASLTFPLSGATMDATLPVKPDVNCISTLTLVPAITDDASHDPPEVNVGVMVPLVE